MVPVLLELPWVAINTYGTLILLGGLLAFPGVWWDMRTRGLGPRATSFTIDFFLAVIVGAFVGGRLLHLVTAPETYAGRWWRAFTLDATGFVFFGSLLAIIAGLALLARRYDVRAATIYDVAATWMPLGHAFGRLGCLGAGCCWGAPTTGSWALRFPSEALVYSHEPELRDGATTLALHPVQLYEALALAGVFVLLLVQRLRGIEPPWRQASRYAMAYGIMRFVTEIFRGDAVRGHLLELRAAAVADLLCLPPDQPLLLSTGQAIAVGLITLGAWGLGRSRT